MKTGSVTAACILKIKVLNFIYSAQVLSAFELCSHPGIDDIECELLADHPCSHANYVGIIVSSAHFCHLYRCAQSGSDARDLIACDADTNA